MLFILCLGLLATALANWTDTQNITSFDSDFTKVYADHSTGYMHFLTVAEGGNKLRYLQVNQFLCVIKDIILGDTIAPSQVPIAIAGKSNGKDLYAMLADCDNTGTRRLRFAESHDGGSVWSPLITVFEQCNIGPYAWDIIVSPADRVFIFYTRDYKLCYRVRAPDSKVFSGEHDIRSSYEVLPTRVRSSIENDVFVIHIFVSMRFKPYTSALQYLNSTDNGNTWSPLIPLYSFVSLSFNYEAEANADVVTQGLFLGLVPGTRSDNQPVSLLYSLNSGRKFQKIAASEQKIDAGTNVALSLCGTLETPLLSLFMGPFSGTFEYYLADINSMQITRYEQPFDDTKDVRKVYSFCHTNASHVITNVLLFVRLYDNRIGLIGAQDIRMHDE